MQNKHRKSICKVYAISSKPITRFIIGKFSTKYAPRIFVTCTKEIEFPTIITYLYSFRDDDYNISMKRDLSIYTYHIF
jgi:hypothetical protein